MARDKCQKNLTMRSVSVCCSIFIVVPTVPSSCFCFYASFSLSSSSSSCHDLCPCVFLCIEKCFVRVFVLMVYLARGAGVRAADLLVPLSLPSPVCVGNLSFADSTNKRFFLCPTHPLLLPPPLHLPLLPLCWLFITIYCCLPQRIDKKKASSIWIRLRVRHHSRPDFQFDSRTIPVPILIAYKVNIFGKFIAK